MIFLYNEENLTVTIKENVCLSYWSFIKICGNNKKDSVSCFSHSTLQNYSLSLDETLNFFFLNQVCLLLYWCFWAGFAVKVVINYNTKKTSITSSVRKYFHLVMIGVYLPGLIIDTHFLSLAASFAFAILLGLEVWNISIFMSFSFWEGTWYGFIVAVKQLNKTNHNSNKARKANISSSITECTYLDAIMHMDASMFIRVYMPIGASVSVWVCMWA